MSTVVYTLPRLFQPIGATPISAGIYPMKRISDFFNHGGDDNVEAMMPEIIELEKHWTSISDKLAKLQVEISAARVPAKSAHASSLAVSNEFVDLVIRANPSRPPYSLPLIKKHLEERLGLEIFAKTHVHSAAAHDSALTENLKHFISSDQKLQRSKAQLAITLIWTKGDEEVSLMVSPSSQSVAIRGESNIARFILRRYPALFDYEGSDLHRTAHFDHLLDLSELITGVNKKERAAALKMLEKPLTSGPSVVTGVSQLNPVDFVLYSAVINSSNSNTGEVGQPFRAWLDRCRGPRATLEKYLEELGVSYHTVNHPAAFTVPELLQHVSSIEGLHAKNLLVKDKKSSRLYLITARHDANVRLDQVAKLVGAKELRFADAETLHKSLSVSQGSVTPFALLNDAKNHIVTLVLDDQLWVDGTLLNFHPLINNATTSISVNGFKKFLQSTGHQPIFVQL